MNAGELAERVGLESRSAVERWERGEGRPERETFPALARELGIPADALMRLAGLESVDLPGDPLLVGLADQAADIERRLRALATAPVTAIGERVEVADEFAKAIVDRKGGGSGAKKKRRRK